MREHNTEDFVVDLAKVQLSHSLSEKQEKQLREAVRKYGCQLTIQEANDIIKDLVSR